MNTFENLSLEELVSHLSELDQAIVTFKNEVKEGLWSPKTAIKYLSIMETAYSNASLYLSTLEGVK